MRPLKLLSPISPILVESNASFQPDTQSGHDGTKMHENCLDRIDRVPKRRRLKGANQGYFQGFGTWQRLGNRTGIDYCK